MQVRSAMDQIGGMYASSALLTGHMVPQASTTTASSKMPRVFRVRAATVSAMMTLCLRLPWSGQRLYLAGAACCRDV